MTALRTALLTLLAAVILTGCGGSGGSPDEPATLVLDFTPNAVHGGIYLALEHDFFAGEGVDMTVQVPSASTDSVRDLIAGRVQFAVLDIHDLALAREKGRDLVGVMALDEVPLAALIAQPGISTPRALDGRRIGVSGLPSDVAVAHSIVSGAGGSAASLKLTTIGFNAVPALLGRKVQAATAFWDVEGVALRARRPATRIFKVDDYGAPSYPELVVTTTRREIDDDPSLVRDTVTALVRGESAAVDDPADATAAIVQQVTTADQKALQQQSAALTGAFTDPATGHVGQLNLTTLRAWAAWEQKFGIVKKPVDVTAAFDPSFARKAIAEAKADTGS